MKSMKKIALLLVFCLCLNTIIPTKAYAQTMTSNLSNDLSEISDDTIIAYIDGVPITKNDVDKNGRILLDTSSVEKNTVSIKDVVDTSKNPNENNTIQPYLIPSGTTWYQEATVKKILSVQGFSQETYDMYLTVGTARDMARRFDVSSIESIGTYLLGFMPGAQAPAVVLLVSQLQRSQVASDIRKYTDNGNQVRFRLIDSRYGTLYRVDYWDGSTLDYTLSANERVAYTSLRMPI
ncbi:hypothetical protein [Clostridium sp. 1001275B_160808_H3]|uniref:hypothetical protein n=1 Tax=Clostridium sp. 1001275B_160808_H3 TaxID=2787110 RepID=UPI00189A3B78|nr:hypothetical protein [Clostridium sp. 1001275B_160808_H3]